MKTGSHTPAQIAKLLEEALDARKKLEAEAVALDRDREAVARKLEASSAEIERLVTAFVRGLPPDVRQALRIVELAKEARSIDGTDAEDEGQGVRAGGGDAAPAGVPG